MSCDATGFGREPDVLLAVLLIADAYVLAMRLVGRSWFGQVPQRETDLFLDHLAELLRPPVAYQELHPRPVACSPVAPVAEDRRYTEHNGNHFVGSDERTESLREHRVGA